MAVKRKMAAEATKTVCLDDSNIICKEHNTKQPQNQILLRHLQDGGTITSIEAIYSFGITRLASRISDLKRMGYSFSTSWETNEAGARWKRYSLCGEDQ